MKTGQARDWPITKLILLVIRKKIPPKLVFRVVLRLLYITESDVSSFWAAVKRPQQRITYILALC